MPEDLDIKNFLKDRIRDRGLNVKRLAELSGIPPSHLHNLSEGDLEHLPAAPYLRGYIWKLGQILEFDPKVFWDYVQKSDAIRSSGSADELPKNRFAPQSLARYGWISLIVVLFALYLGLRIHKIFGEPLISVRYPDLSLEKVAVASISVAGRVENASELFVNNEEVTLSSTGEWQKDVLLEPGLNTIEVRAKKFLGGESKVIRQVIYEPAPSSGTSSPRN